MLNLPCDGVEMRLKAGRERLHAGRGNGTDGYEAEQARFAGRGRVSMPLAQSMLAAQSADGAGEGKQSTPYRRWCSSRSTIRA